MVANQNQLPPQHQSYISMDPTKLNCQVPASDVHEFQDAQPVLQWARQQTVLPSAGRVTIALNPGVGRAAKRPSSGVGRAAKRPSSGVGRAAKRPSSGVGRAAGRPLGTESEKEVAQVVEKDSTPNSSDEILDSILFPPDEILDSILFLDDVTRSLLYEFLPVLNEDELAALN